MTMRPVGGSASGSLIFSPRYSRCIAFDLNSQFTGKPVIPWLEVAASNVIEPRRDCNGYRAGGPKGGSGRHVDSGSALPRAAGVRQAGDEALLSGVNFVGRERAIRSAKEKPQSHAALAVGDLLSLVNLHQ